MWYTLSYYGRFFYVCSLLSLPLFLSQFVLEDSTYQAEHLLWWWVWVMQLYWHKVQRLIHKTQLQKSPKYNILSCHFLSFPFWQASSIFLFLVLYIFCCANSGRIYRCHYGKRCILTDNVNISVIQLSGQRF